MTSPYDDAATKAVTDKIAAVDYKTNGAPFGEILISVCPSKYFAWRWQYDSSALFAFFPPAGYSSQFLPLGDYAGDLSSDPRPLLFAMSNSGPVDGKPAALAHPTGFDWVGDDGGSGNGNDMNFWKPIAPPGYVAMGICWLWDPKPDPSLYWCVREDLCLQVSESASWYVSENGRHGSNFTLYLYSPMLTQEVIDACPEDHVLIPAPTFTAYGLAPYCLQLPRCLLLVDEIAVEEPKYVASGEQPIQFNMGLTGVVVVPYTVIGGDPIDDQVDRSPFYYFAAEPYYAFSSGFPSPNGGSQTVSVTVGLSSTASESFNQSTSLTLSADTGGNFAGIDSKFSASVTDSMSLDLQATVEGHTEVNIQTTVDFPVAQEVFLWQNMVSIVPFRQDGSQMLSVSYQNKTTRMTNTPT